MMNLSAKKITLWVAVFFFSKVIPHARSLKAVLPWGFLMGRKTSDWHKSNSCCAIWEALRVHSSVVVRRKVQVFLTLLLLSVPQVSGLLAVMPDGIKNAEKPLTERFSINLPAQSVAKSLNSLARQSGAQFLFSYDLAESRMAKPVVGQYTLPVAVELLLQGTGLKSDFDNGVLTISVSEEVNEPVDQEKTGSEKMTPKRGLFASLIALLAGSGQAVADDNDDFVFEEIIVTAQKRAQSLSDVPVAVSVLTSDVFESQALTNLTDALELTPNIEIVESANGAEVVMRGVSRGAVATLLDGVGQSSRESTFASPIADVERVEVLRGPQGSVYGRNAAGGVINYVTKAPSDEFEAQLRADFGNHEYRQFAGLINVPLVDDKLAMRINAYHEHDGGWIDNEIDGRTLESSKKYGVRGQLLFTPKDNFSARLMVQYNNNKPDSHASYYIQGSPVMDFWVATINNALGKNLPSINGDIFSGVANVDGSLSAQAENLQVQAHLTWDTDWASLMSITAYTKLDRSEDGLDIDVSALDMVKTDRTLDRSNFSQEFRLVSADSDTFEYVAGLYFERTTFDEHTDWFFGEDGDFILNALFSQQVAAGVNPFLPAPLLPTNGSPLFVSGTFNGLYDTDIIGGNTETYSAFANGTFKVNEKFHLTAGGRINRTNAARDELGLPVAFNLSESALPAYAAFAPFFPTAQTIPTAIAQSGPIDDVNETDWGASLKGTYFANDDMMLYASVTRGFSPGRISVVRVSDTENRVDQLPEEIVWSYEVGTKSSFLDNRLLLNSSLYFLDYSNFRTTTLVGANTEVSNAGTMHNYGFELEAIARPIPELTLNASLGYTHATYKSADGEDSLVACYLGQTAAEGCVGGSQVRTGKQVEGSARWNGNLGLTYRKDLKDDWQWFLSGDMSFRSSILRESDFDPRSTSAAYQRINARLGFENNAYSIIFWGRNLTNERYIINGFRAQLAGVTDGAYLGQPNQPRTYGVTLTARF